MLSYVLKSIILMKPLLCGGLPCYGNMYFTQTSPTLMQLQGICRLGTCINEVLSYETFVVRCFTMLWEHVLHLNFTPIMQLQGMYRWGHISMRCFDMFWMPSKLQKPLLCGALPCYGNMYIATHATNCTAAHSH